MTNRMQKYANKRRAIEIENTLFYIANPQKWLKIQKYQKAIKYFIGARH